MFTSGCFTAMRHYCEAWNGDSTKTQKITTTALDFATFPIQVIVVPDIVFSPAKEAADKNRAKQQADAYKQFMPLLENDPALGLKERWDLKKDLHQWVFMQSFSNPKIKYTDALLEEIHQTCPSIRNFVFSSKSCSKEFLEKHFDEEFERAKNPAHQGGLAAIVSNPNTTLDLVEKVATAKGYPAGVTMPAENALFQRGSKIWMDLLEQDSTIALQERWDIKNGARQLVFQRSFANPKVKYTDQLLEEICVTCPTVRDDLYLSSSCSKEFLARHFDEEFERGKNWVFQDGIIHMINNPNMPIELIEKMASAKSYSATDAPPHVAQRVLAKRRSELMAQPINNQKQLSP